MKGFLQIRAHHQTRVGIAVSWYRHSITLHRVGQYAVSKGDMSRHGAQRAGTVGNRNEQGIVRQIDENPGHDGILRGIIERRGGFIEDQD